MIGSTKWLISLDKNRKLIKERREEVNWLFISFSWHFLNAHSQLSTLICQFVIVLHVQLSKHSQYFIFKEEIIEILAAAASLFILVAVVCVSHLPLLVRGSWNWGCLFSVTVSHTKKNGKWILRAWKKWKFAYLRIKDYNSTHTSLSNLIS